MFKTIQIIVMAALCLNFSAKAQSPTNNIKPLKIGDTIPKEVWNIPLHVFNHPEGKKIITLNDYRDKLIILDFMNFRCSGCISKLPQFDSLHRASYKDLQVLIITSDSIKLLSKFFQKSPIAKRLSLPIVMMDTTLKKAFPHRYISHIVCIHNETVKVVTHAKYLIDKNIKMLLQNEYFNWPIKDDFTITNH